VSDKRPLVSSACNRTQQNRAADAGVEAVGKQVDNFTVLNSEAERLPKLNSQWFVTLIFTYKPIFGASFGSIFNPFVLLQRRYV
jgi:hypothetical protein